jgi:hypothetical protein
MLISILSKKKRVVRRVSSLLHWESVLIRGLGSLEGDSLVVFCYLSASEDLHNKRVAFGRNGLIRRRLLYSCCKTCFFKKKDPRPININYQNCNLIKTTWLKEYSSLLLIRPFLPKANKCKL